jgi:Family of unknown function (DUF6444)
VSFLSREEFIELARIDAGKLYDIISAKFAEYDARIKELENKLNQNSKNSSKPHRQATSLRKI